MLVLVAPSAASGTPITAGVWSPVPVADTDQDPFWDGLSWDCPTCSVWFQLAGYAGLAGLEYLHDGNQSFVPFRFEDPDIAPALIFQATGWMNGSLGRDSEGAFTYDSGTGRLSDSWQAPGQYALFRKVGTETTQYFLGIEDILLSEAANDRDYNDYVVTFLTQNVPPPTFDTQSEPDLTFTARNAPEDTVTTQSVPEPSSLLLLGTAIAGLTARRLRALRTAKIRRR